MAQDKIRVTFLDVGQGDCTLITLPDNVTAIVVDCPGGREKDALEYLETAQIRTLHIFASHTDLDHLGGIANLAQNFDQVAMLAYNETLIPDDATYPGRREVVLRHLAQLLERRRDITSHSPRAGMQWSWQGAKVVVLHPDDRDIKRLRYPEDTNNGSVVLRITFAGRSVLLTGDLGSKGWQWIIDRGGNLQADILKFPHHGAWVPRSGTRLSLSEILQQIAPSLVVLSLGSHNAYGHPKLETLKLLRTFAKLRIMCTEATSKCHAVLAHTSANIPCAGNVEIEISNSGIVATPSKSEHRKVIKGFDDPQCQPKRHIRRGR